MFVTLRANSKRSAEPGMQELALRKARPGEARGQYGTSRRPSCIQCRSKKLRCMGDGNACARCEVSGLICEDAPTKRRRTGNGSRVTPSSRTGETTKSAATVSENGLGESVARVAPLPGAVPNTSERLPDVSNTDASAAHLVAPSSIPQPPQLHVPNESHPNDWGTFVSPSWLNPNLSTGSLDALNLAELDGLFSQDDLSTPASNTIQCSCIQDALEISSTLDDDPFRLRAFTFDEVLRHQKHIILHCFRPIACETCSPKPTSYTVAMLLCGRLAGTFTCLTRRLENTRILGSLHNPAYTSIIVPRREDPAIPPPQTCDSAPDESLMNVVCNSLLFSPQFRDQYSGEEQYHMARVLARVQLRNFNQLLVRISEVEHVRNSQGRTVRVQALKSRLQELRGDMEEGFRRILETAGKEGADGVALTNV